MIYSLINALGAPLVNDEILRKRVALKETLRACNRSHDFAEFRTSQTFPAVAYDDHRSASFKNSLGRNHCLADLIKGRIKGIPATGSNHQIGRLIQWDRTVPANHFTTRQMGMVVVAGKYTGNISLLIDDHIENKIHARKPRNPKTVFVKGIACQKAVFDIGVID